MESKRELYEEYKTYFTKADIKFRENPADSDWNNWLICVELRDLEERNAFLEVTNSNGVMTRPIWQLMYRLPMYEDCQMDSQINAELLEERIVNIPSRSRNPKA
jgi:perosamine synthetase